MVVKCKSDTTVFLTASPGRKHLVPVRYEIKKNLGCGQGCRLGDNIHIYSMDIWKSKKIKDKKNCKWKR